VLTTLYDEEHEKITQNCNVLYACKMRLQIRKSFKINLVLFLLLKKQIFSALVKLNIHVYLEILELSDASDLVVTFS